VQRLKNITFNGMSGRVVLDHNGDRRADWSWFNFQDGAYVHVGDYMLLNDTYVPKSTIIWHGGGTVPPLDSLPLIETERNTVLVYFIFVLSGTLSLICSRHFDSYHLTITYSFNRFVYDCYIGYHCGYRKISPKDCITTIGNQT
jgi:hypothetical protein